MASLKFQNCPNETEILQSNFEIINSESKSQQSTSQLNERELIILPRKFCQFYKITYNLVKSPNFLSKLVKAQNI